jgi:WXG100 family type VII secretion target
MALGQFTIDFSSMQNTVEQAKQQSGQISNLLDEMRSQIMAKRDNWTGAAADAFQQAYDFCHQRAMTLPAALDAAAHTLSVIGDGSKSVELGNAKRFDS